jgi:hypothetical protein
MHVLLTEHAHMIPAQVKVVNITMSAFIPRLNYTDQYSNSV